MTEIHRAKMPDGREMTVEIDGDRATITLPDGRVIEYVEDANAPDPNGCYHADMVRDALGDDGYADLCAAIEAGEIVACGFGDPHPEVEVVIYEYGPDDGPDFSNEPGGTNWCGW